MKAVVYDKTGDPREVLQVRDVPAPIPGFRQVRVRMLASPINPSDLYTVEGRYLIRQQLPSSPGYEGVGIVEETGGGVLGWLRKGKRVAVVHERGGTWAEHAVVPARHVVPVPDSVPNEQAASFFVNPVTALAMVRDVLRVQRQEWLLQSAAGSALGKMVIRLAKLDGFRTINVVRRPEQIAELQGIGGDVVVCDAAENLVERVRSLTGGAGVRCAIDPVGGKTGSDVIRCLAPGGRALLFGLLSGQPIEVDPRFMIDGSKRVEGFWLTNWIRRQNVIKLLKTFRAVKRLMLDRVIQSDIAATYPLQDIRKAAEHAASAARGGKILLQIGS